MDFLFDAGRYTHSLFFGHLYIEKICKALWIKNHKENTPPYIHNLLKILQGIETGLSDAQFVFLEQLNEYQLSGRYPNYTETLKKRTTKDLTLLYIDKINAISSCLREKL